MNTIFNRKINSNNYFHHRMSRRFLAFIVALSVVLAVLPAYIFSANASKDTLTNAYWTDSNNYDTTWYNEQSAKSMGNSAEKPFEISTPQQFAGVAALNNGLNGAAVDFTDKFIQITMAFDLSEHHWTPIGTLSNPFKGSFDGGNHVMSGLTINTTSDYQGLFGYAENSTIKNVGVVDSSIIGGDYVGGIVGWNYTDGLGSNATVSNCYNTGTVSGAIHVGGVIGYNDGIISNCYNTGAIGASENSGGIAGSNTGAILNCSNTSAIDGNQRAGGVAGYNVGTISNAYNTGTVSGSSSVGGVAGDHEGTILNCYNTGAVDGTERAGGMIGYNTGTISNAYNAGVVSGSTLFGGVIGENAGTVQDTYFLKDTGINDILAGIGGPSATDSGASAKSKVQLKSIVNLTGFGAADWTNAPSRYVTTNPGVFTASNPVNNGYPVLKAFGYTGVDTSIETQLPKDGDGAYLIKNAYQLDLIRNYLGSGSSTKKFRIANSIDVSPASYNKSIAPENSWKPIGAEATAKKFYATLDGAGFTVSGIYIDSVDLFQGLFGYTQNSTIKNLGIVDCNILGGGYVGGVVGYNGSISSGTATVSNCYNIGKVTAKNIKNYGISGGIVGYNYSEDSGTNALVENCYNIGVISGPSNVGGIVGWNMARTKGMSKVTNSHNAGTVNATTTYLDAQGVNTSGIYAGGVAGQESAVSGGTAIVINCYNAGTVSGPSRTGGIIGYVNANSSTDVSTATVSNSYNIGVVNGTGETADYVGGIVGYNYTSTKGIIRLEDCYNTGTISGREQIGGIIGCNDSSNNGIEAVVTNTYNAGAISGAQYVGGIIGFTNVPTNKVISLTNSYNIGVISGDRSGGIIGMSYGSLLSTISDCYYTGASTGVSGYADKVGKTTFFVKLESNSIGVNNTTTILEQTTSMMNEAWSQSLGADFTVLYSSYTSDVASIQGTTVTGESVGNGNVTAITIIVTQNELAMDGTGFTGPAKQLTTSAVMPLAVTDTKLTPKIALAADPTSVVIGGQTTLTATVSEGNNPTGTITFKKEGIQVGDPVVLSNGVATIPYTATTINPLLFTAVYSGDTNNKSITSTEVTVVVTKAQPTLSTPTASPGPDSQTVTLSSTLSNYYGDVKDRTVIFYSGTTKIGEGITDANGVATCPWDTPDVGEYIITTEFEEDTNNKGAISGELIYNVEKGTNLLTVTCEDIFYGEIPNPVVVNPNGGEVTYQYKAEGAEDYSDEVPTDAGEYTVKATSAANYNEAIATATFNIKPIALTVRILPNSKVYDGNNNATTNADSIVYSGIINSDDVHISGGTLLFADKNAGIGKVVTASGYNLDGVSKSNYNLETITVDAADISKAILTVSTINQTINVGEAIPDFTLSYAGFVGNENQNNLSGFAAPTIIGLPADSSTAGIYALTMSGGQPTDNYLFQWTDAALTINAQDDEIVTTSFADDSTTLPTEDITSAPDDTTPSTEDITSATDDTTPSTENITSAPNDTPSPDDNTPPTGSNSPGTGDNNLIMLYMVLASVAFGIFAVLSKKKPAKGK